MIMMVIFTYPWHEYNVNTENVKEKSTKLKAKYLRAEEDMCDVIIHCQ